MRVQFVFAPPIEKPRLAELGEGISPPLGLLYMASYLRSKLNGIQLKVTDGLLRGYKNTLSEIKSFGPDVLFLSYYTLTALSAYKLINELKEENPRLLVVTGGPHATALPEEAFRKSKVDIVVRGEGEETAYQLVKRFGEKRRTNYMDYGQIDGITFRKNGEVVRTSPRQFIKDLDSIPFPAIDLVNIKEYRGWYLCKRTPETTMIMSRGCSYHCTFCSNKVWKSSRPYVRVRSPKNVVDEIELLMKEYGIKEVFDNSDEFNNNLKNSMAICEEIKRRKLEVSWKTQVRAHPLPEELVKAMADAGCWYVHLGIESGNPEVLKGVKKHITLEQVTDSCKKLKKYGIKVHGLFMLFNVWQEDGELKFEDVDMTRNTLSFAEKLVDKKLLDYIGWSITTPYPGSKLYDIALKFGLIKKELLENWDAWLSDDSFVMKLPGIDEVEQARMKTSGSVLRAKCMLRSGNFGIKDMGFITRKVLKIIKNEVTSRLGRSI